MAENFDLFNFEHCSSMLGILGDPITTVTAAVGQTVLNYPNPPGTSCDLGVLSGELLNGGFSQADVRLSLEPLDGVGQQWTLEWAVTFESLPPDFSSLVNNHVYIGASDASGPVAGLFISEIGIAYTGSVHHVANNLVTDAAVTTIPGTASRIVLGTQTTFRLVVDGFSNVVYLFVTPTSEVELTGHQLVAILPVLDAAGMAFPPIDQSFITVRGTTAIPSRVAFDAIRMASTLVVPNLPPIADAGIDQAVRLCSIALFDGRASFDPEGAALTYHWRLINAPLGSAFLFAGSDGHTHPLVSPTGFTDKFHSNSLGTEHALNPIAAGDVILLDNVVYDIVTTGSDGNGFYVLVTEPVIPEPQTGRPFRLLRQYGISGPTTAQPTFFPDVLGFYKFDLIVSDGSLDSVPAVVVLNVVDSPLPRGVIPDASFIFDYLSDYWSLVEDRDPIATVWSSVAQIAAAELYTLWQHDYGKSLRDIQRTFLRRWLHYDLLLAEPVPELTTFRVFYGGRTTTAIAAGGIGGMSGTSFKISSGVHATKTITLVTANPVTAAQFAAEVRNRLLEVDGRYTVQLFTQSNTDQFVRINAPFLFSITNSTVPVLPSGPSVLASGPGDVINTRTYRTDTSLTALNLQEDDLLILGTEAYRISQVVDDPGDDFRFQRVVVKSDIQSANTSQWKITGYVTSQLLDFYSGLVSLGDAVYFEVVDLSGDDAQTRLVKTTCFTAAADAPSNLAFDISQELSDVLASPDLFDVHLAKIVRRTYLPIDESIVDIPTLIELIEIVDDQATLRRNLDFFIEEYRGQHCLHFVSGQLGGDDVWESLDPPDRLWAEYTYLDNNPTIEANFGILAEVSVDQIAALPGDVDYLSAVRGIWYAYINGPTLRNLRVGSQILLGLPFAEEAGTIEEIRTDFSPSQGRILIRDSERTEIVRSYTFPKTLGLEVNPDTNQVYAVGDAVTQFAPLVEGVEIVDYVKDPEWFVGLLNQGIFYEVEKYFKFLVRVDSAAFGQESLSFVRDFLLKIKPTITYPLFLVSQKLDEETEISVTDTLKSTTTVKLIDGLCTLSPFSTSIDDPRPSTGGYWNQVDTDSNDATPLPTFPTPDAVAWAVDRYVFCPVDLLQAHICEVFPAPAAAGTSANLDDTKDLFNDANFKENGPFTIANGAVGESITANVGTTVPLNGTIERVRLLIAGGPGTDPAAYSLVIAINGVDTLTHAFTSVANYTHVAFVESQAVTAADVITAFIRHAGGSPRSPAWTSVRIDVSINLGNFAAADVLPIGNYCVERDPLI